MDTQRGQDPFIRSTDAYCYTYRQMRLRQPAWHRSRNLYRDPLQPVSRVHPRQRTASPSPWAGLGQSVYASLSWPRKLTTLPIISSKGLLINGGKNSLKCRAVFLNPAPGNHSGTYFTTNAGKRSVSQVNRQGICAYKQGWCQQGIFLGSPLLKNHSSHSLQFRHRGRRDLSDLDRIEYSVLFLWTLYQIQHHIRDR